MNATLRFDFLDIAAHVVAIDRAALAADPAAYTASTTLTIRAAYTGRTADFPAEIDVNRDTGRTSFLSLGGVYGSFFRAVAKVLGRPVAVDLRDPDDRMRSTIADAERTLAAAFAGLDLSTVPDANSLDLDRVLPMLFGAQTKEWGRRTVAEDVAELGRWIAKHKRLPTFSWTGMREENALAVRAHAYVRHLALADGIPLPPNPMVAAETDGSVRTPRLQRTRRPDGAA